ncbi:MAG TPA: IucA/IucC family protein [Stenotrophomonas sp.]|nr:IucA/IucC family protein [Stenotrophomonas sp.]
MHAHADELQAHAALVSAPAYKEAGRRVLRQLLEALLFEDLLPVQWLAPDSACVQAGAESAARYHFGVQRGLGFGRVRILGKIWRHCAQVRQEALDPAQFLADVGPLLGAEDQAVQQLAAELLATRIKHAQTLAGASPCLLRDADYDTVEARLGDAHPYHPCFKSRLGFNLADNARFGPELAAPLSPWLLAVRRDCCQYAASRALDAVNLRHILLGETDARHFDAALAQQQLDPDAFLPLPVHPWQWREVIAPLHHGAFARGELVGVGAMAARYQPQQSLRSLANLDQRCGWTLKLALSLVNTSTSRVLAPHTVLNAAAISDWLQATVDGMAWPAPMTAPILLREQAGICHVPSAAAAGQYGALACIWRESVHRRLPRALSALPMSALCHTDADDQLLIAPWLRRYGIQAWLRRLLERAFLPVLHLLWSQGIALESHAQNMVLLHADGWPGGVMLKDFHDGVRFAPQWLAAPAPPLRAPSAEHARVNANSGLHSTVADEVRDFAVDALLFVNLAELGWSLLRFHGLAESRFWRVVAGVIADYQAQHPQLAAAFARFNVQARSFGIEALARRRLHPQDGVPARQAPNPLAEVWPCR